MKFKFTIFATLLLVSSIPFALFLFSNVKKLSIEFVQTGETTNRFYEYSISRIRHTNKTDEKFYVYGLEIDESKISTNAKNAIGNPANIQSCATLTFRTRITPNISFSDSLLSVDCGE